jgi:hypothetical protein
MSGTYSVSVQPSVSKIPREEFRVSIELGADPKRIDELSRAIFEEIGRLQTDGPDEEEVKEVRTAESRDYETSSRQNGWWLSQLAEQYRLGENPAEVLRIPAALDLITKDVVQKAARTYFNMERYVQVTLYPEKSKKTECPLSERADHCPGRNQNQNGNLSFLSARIGSSCEDAEPGRPQRQSDRHRRAHVKLPLKSAVRQLDG